MREDITDVSVASKGKLDEGSLSIGAIQTQYRTTW